MFDYYAELIGSADSLAQLDFIADEYINDESITDREFLELCMFSRERIQELRLLL